MGYLYLITDGTSYKLGIANDVESRLAQLQTGNANELVIEKCYEFPNSQAIETVLHQRYDCVRKRGEWFNLSYKDRTDIETICEMLGGVEYYPNVLVEDSELDGTEALAEPTDGAKFDYAAMFADGWFMEIAGNGRDNGKNKYWGWRKRNLNAYIYGGKISDLPYPIEEMRRIYRDGGSITESDGAK